MWEIWWWTPQKNRSEKPSNNSNRIPSNAWRNSKITPSFISKNEPMLCTPWIWSTVVLLTLFSLDWRCFPRNWTRWIDHRSDTRQARWSESILSIHSRCQSIGIDQQSTGLFRSPFDLRALKIAFSSLCPRRVDWVQRRALIFEPFPIWAFPRRRTHRFRWAMGQRSFPWPWILFNRSETNVLLDERELLFVAEIFVDVSMLRVVCRVMEIPVHRRWRVILPQVFSRLHLVPIQRVQLSPIIIIVVRITQSFDRHLDEQT